jgi:methyl-accepting chemotaxis protein
MNIRLTVGTKLAFAFGVCVILFIGLGAVGYNSTNQNLERAASVTHTYQVKMMLSILLSDLQDAETGQRGYIITGLDSYLEPFTRGIASIEEDRKALQKLTADNPNQQRRLADLDPLVRAKIAELTQTIDLRRTKDFEGAKAIVLNDTGRKVMDDIRVAIKGIDDEESALLMKRETESSQSAITAYWALGLMTLGGTLFTLIIALFLTRSLTSPLGKTVQMIRRIGNGELDSRLKMGRKDEIGILADTMDQLAETINSLISDMNDMSRQQEAGDLDVKIAADKYCGAFKVMANGVNDMVFGHIAIKKKAMACVSEFGRGNFEAPLEQFPGKKAFINETIEQVRRNLKALISDTEMLTKAAVEGKLDVRADVEKHQGDFRKIVHGINDTLNKVVENLRGANKELQGGIDILASSSTEILATVSQVAASASETATAVSETSTTAEEVKQTAHLSNQKAKAVQESAQKAASISEAGRKSVAETIEGMNRIHEQMESIAESVVRLSEQGQTIGEIIATVNDLAEQSNLLAVNAAIEATRAGESGKAFAVVAQEVKTLAEQSRQATTQVRTILMEVQKATSAAVMATEQGSKAVAAGVLQATVAGESIGALAGSVSEAAQAAMQIAASSQQQLVGMDQIALAISNIQQATTQNVAGTKQLEASARGLQELGGRLKVLVERQKVEG